MKLTKKHIEELKTENGGYNYATIEALGEETPPTSGWIGRMIGSHITERQYQKALECSNVVRRKKLPDNDMLKPLDLHIVYEMNGQIKEAFKHWRLDVAELVLDRAGSKYWEIGIGASPNLKSNLTKP